MLRIDLTRADVELIRIDERLSLSADCCGEDVVSPGEIRLAGEVEHLERGYLFSGEASGQPVLRCVRCLGEFPFSFTERFELRLLPLAVAPQEEETRLSSADLDVRFYAEPWLDLAELAAEQLQLAVPMKPLCHEDCQGLCPSCGADLNRGRCACPPSRDGRWNALLGFRPRR